MLSALVALFILALATLVGAVLYLRWHHNYWTQRGVVGPRPALVKGTFPNTYAGRCNLIEELHDIYLEYKHSQRFVGVFAARSPKLFVLDPQLASDVLTRHFASFRDNESSQWTSPRIEQMRLCSPFVSTGDAWKERRSELVPALTANRLRAFYPSMLKCAEKLVAYIKAAPAEVPLDVKELANRYTAEFIADFIWGIEAGAFAAAAKCTIHRMADSMIAQALDCVHYYGGTAAWPWLRQFRPVRFFPARSDEFFQRLAADALALRARSPGARCDVIDHLQQLREKQSLNGEQIAGHTTTVLIDGFETVAIVIAHCLLLLSRNGRVQEQLRREVAAAGADIAYDALNELPYLDQCLQETVRIFPPLPTLFKLCTAPVTLRKADADADGQALTLRPGDVAYISAYSLHRDADYFEQPDEYRPERFAAEVGGVRKYRDMGVFLPFGDGPRMCPGLKLGWATAKVAVAEILRQFRIHPGQNTRGDNKIAPDSFLATLAGPIELIFEPFA